MSSVFKKPKFVKETESLLLKCFVGVSGHAQRSYWVYLYEWFTDAKEKLAKMVLNVSEREAKLSLL